MPPPLCPRGLEVAVTGHSELLSPARAIHSSLLGAVVLNFILNFVNIPKYSFIRIAAVALSC